MPKVQRRTSTVGTAIGLLLVACTCAAAGAVTQSAATELGCTKVAFEFPLPAQVASEAVLAGARQVASAYGFCRPAYGAPPATTWATGQVADIKADIGAGDKVIMVDADDPVVPGPVLEAAMKAGAKVVTFGSDVPGARDLFVQATSYGAMAHALIGAAVEAEGPKAELLVMAMTPDSEVELAWLGAMRSYAGARHVTLEIGGGQAVMPPSLKAAEQLMRAYPGADAILAIDDASIAGAAEAVTDLHRTAKIGVFGIGDPAPLRRYFANGSLRALFGWDEDDEGELLMCVAKLAYDDIQPASTFSCPRGPTGSWAVTAKDNPGTGATRGTVIFSRPLEFTAENYKSYDF